MFNLILIKLLGAPHKLTFENRGLNAMNGILVLICLVMVAINVIFNQVMLLNVLYMGLVVLFGFNYYLSRFANAYRKSLLIMVSGIITALAYLWFKTGGITGSASFAILFMIICIIQFTEKRFLTTTVSLLLVSVLILIVVSVLFPSMVIQLSAEEREYRMTMSFITGAVITIPITLFFKINFINKQHKEVRHRKEIEQYKNQLENLMDTISEEFYVFSRDVSEVILFASDHPQAVFGEEYTTENIAQHLKDNILPQKKASDEHTFEAKVQRNNSVQWIKITEFEVIEAGKVVRIDAIAQDVTKRKFLQQKVTQALEKERQLNESQRQFVSMISHQFRTPLTVIKTASQFIQQLSSEQREEVKSMIAGRWTQIYSNIDQLTEFMESILTLHQHESRKIKFTPGKYNIVEMISQICEQYAMLDFHNREIQIVTENENIEWLFDITLLRQAFSNLISNAYKYSPGAVAPRIFITEKNDTLSVEVRDFGMGIPEHQRDKLFKPFFRATNTDQIKGTGVGLTLVKHLVELHKGQIRMIFHEQSGTSFFIDLPRQPDKQTAPLHNVWIEA
ncbi:HAMP domain-containing sensor histidine kinase [Persicobacter psychrovividus]|uniref:histidine kinase n=1 Tax=Persicobacter psychrovividus TaxID=387638 RepID=A0ABN6LF16_9BACT|nr:hypothetical protein PEPS_40310 [Persicobacter psychrovividus]